MTLLSIEPKRLSSERILVSFGANEGDAIETFYRSIQALAPVIQNIVPSGFYKTEPHYDKPDAVKPICRTNDYVNAVFMGETILTPHALLRRLLEVEQHFGRKRPDASCAPRPIDLDLLLYGERVIQDTELTVPHPRMHLRNFVLVPACEITPAWVHPVLGQRLDILCATCPDRLSIAKIESSRA